MSNKTVEIAGAAAFIFVFAAAPAHAYLDPGMGSMLLQALIGGVAGGLFLMRTWWSRIASHLPGARKGAADADARSDDAAQ